MSDSGGSGGISGNTAGGHIAGGNITTTTNITVSAPPSGLMTTLIAKYREEVRNDAVMTDICEKLQHYLNTVDGSNPVVGLQQKLSDAKRDDYARRAMRLKEMFAKRVQQNALSEAAQRIFAFALAALYRRFVASIPPIVQANAPNHVIDKTLTDAVIQPTVVDLLENPLFIDSDDLEGMIYFLTGNCHIRWDTPC